MEVAGLEAREGGGVGGFWVRGFFLEGTVRYSYRKVGDGEGITEVRISCSSCLRKVSTSVIGSGACSLDIVGEMRWRGEFNVCDCSVG